MTEPHRSLMTFETKDVSDRPASEGFYLTLCGTATFVKGDKFRGVGSFDKADQTLAEAGT
jgi:hypothetical protein